MSEDFFLTTDQKNMLEELINISFGLSASLVGDMLSSYAHLEIPKVNIIKIEDLGNYIKNSFADKALVYTIRQSFKGNLYGETVFAIEKSDADILSKLLLEETGDIDDEELKSAMIELSNILTSSCLTQIAKMTQSAIFFMEPSIHISDVTNLIEHNEKAKYDKVVIVDTLLNLPNEGVKGSMFILTNTESFSTLTKMLDGMV